METRNGIIIAFTFVGGLLIGGGLQLNRQLIAGATIWIVAGVFGYLTRTRRIR